MKKFRIVLILNTFNHSATPESVQRFIRGRINSHDDFHCESEEIRVDEAIPVKRKPRNPNINKL